MLPSIIMCPPCLCPEVNEMLMIKTINKRPKIVFDFILINSK